MVSCFHDASQNQFWPIRTISMFHSHKNSRPHMGVIGLGDDQLGRGQGPECRYESHAGHVDVIIPTSSLSWCSNLQAVRARQCYGTSTKIHASHAILVAERTREITDAAVVNPAKNLRALYGRIASPLLGCLLKISVCLSCHCIAFLY